MPLSLSLLSAAQRWAEKKTERQFPAKIFATNIQTQKYILVVLDNFRTAEGNVLVVTNQSIMTIYTVLSGRLCSVYLYQFSNL